MRPLLHKIDEYKDAGLIFLGFAMLYLITRTQSFNYDGVMMALQMEYSRSFPLHAKHILAPLPGWLIYKGLCGAGKFLRALDVLVFINTFVAAFCAAIFYLVLSNAYSRRSAWIGALLLGVSFAFWKEAVDGRVYPIVALASCVLLDHLVNSRIQASVYLGILVGICISIHQMFVLVIPTFWLLLTFESDHIEKHAAVKRCVRFSLSCLIPPLCTYAISLFFNDSLHGIEKLLWVFQPSGELHTNHILHDPYWAWNIVPNLNLFLTTTANSFVFLPPLSGFKLMIAHSLTIIGMFVLAFESWRSWKQSSAREAQNILLLWTWIISMSAFHFFYIVGALRFRVLTLPAMIMLGATLARRKQLQNNATIALTLVLISMALWNFRSDIWPSTKRANNPYLVRIDWLKQQLTPNDYFVFGGTWHPDSIVNINVAYFFPEIRARSLNGLLLQNSTNGLTMLSQFLRSADNISGNIYLEQSLFDPEMQTQLETIGNLPAQTISQWLSSLTVLKTIRGPQGYGIVLLDKQALTHPNNDAPPTRYPAALRRSP